MAKKKKEVIENERGEILVKEELEITEEIKNDVSEVEVVEEISEEKIIKKEEDKETKIEEEIVKDSKEEEFVKTEPVIVEEGKYAGYTDITSSNIDKLFYKEDEYHLFVVFNNGSHYMFHDISPKIYNELINADSVGSYFSNNIRNKFKTESIGD